LFGWWFGPPAFNGYLVIFGLFVLALSGLCFFIFRRKISLILPLFAVLGVLLIAGAVSPVSVMLDEVAAREGFVRVEGRVEDVSTTRRGQQLVTMRAIAFRIGPEPEIHNITTKLRVYLPEGFEAQLGQRLVVSGYLVGLDGLRNPGGFNEVQYLRSRGIEYKIFAESAAGYEIRLTPAMYVRGFGLKLSAVFDEVLPPEMAGIMSAMLVGDRSGLDADVRDLYRSVGLFHILVVSGLHINILAAFFGGLLKAAGVKSNKKRGAATIGFIVGFAVLTGAGIAVVRASIMGIALILAGILGFDNDSPSSLAIAAIILLLYQPLFLFDMGFIFSFTIVLSIILASPKKYAALTAVTTVTAALLSSYIFFEFSPYAFFVNLLLLPLAPVLVVLGLLTALVGLVSTYVAGISAFGIWAVLSFYELVLGFVSRLPFAVVLTGRPSYFVLSLLVLAFLFVVFTLRGLGSIGLSPQGGRTLCAPTLDVKGFVKRLGIGVLVLVVGLFVPYIISVRDEHINITFLDVGQGKATVIHKGGAAVIIDGGGTFGREVGENAGTFNLIPYLNYRGISQADAIVSHNHRDHALGVVEAVLAGRINRLMLARANSDIENEIYLMLINAANLMGVPVSYLSAGDAVEFNGVILQILSPYEDSVFRGENNNSLVIRAVYGGHAVLLTGDIESEAEAYIAGLDAEIKARVLQVPHHGSRSSATEEFLSAVGPQIAVISAGRNNQFGHPHSSVVQRLEEHGITYFNTAANGAVMLRTNGQNMTVSTMLGGKQ
jgi:competence protein ComEC